MSTKLNIGRIPATLKIPVMFLYYLGWFRNKSKRLLIFTIISVILVINMFSLGVMQYTKIKNVSHFVLNLESTFSFIQALGKLLVVAYYNRDLTNLLEDTYQFWNAEGHKEAVTKQTAYTRFVLNSEKVILIIFTVSVVSLITFSCYTNTLIIGVWLVEGYDTIFRFLLLEQILYVIGADMFLYSLDCLYFGMCIELIIQFKIIAYNLRDLFVSIDNHIVTEEECLKKLECCIMHHQYLMRFLKKFKKIYSLILLLQYISGAPIALVEIFAILESKSYKTQLRCIMLFIAFIFQIAVYCIPANYLSDEISAVANDVYFSNWETNMFRSLKAPLVLLIQNTQKGDIMRAGGLVTINAETVLNILKVAWSASSIMRGLK